MNRTNPAPNFLKVDLTGGDVVLSPPCRALILGVGGVVNGISEGATAAAETAVLPAGVIPIAFKEIKQMGTTAAEITAVW